MLCFGDIVVFACSKLTLLSTNSQSRSRLGLFKIPTFRRWMVLTSDPELIEDVKKAPEDVLSLRARMSEVRMSPGTLKLDSFSYRSF